MQLLLLWIFLLIMAVGPSPLILRTKAVKAQAPKRLPSAIIGSEEL